MFNSETHSVKNLQGKVRVLCGLIYTRTGKLFGTKRAVIICYICLMQSQTYLYSKWGGILITTGLFLLVICSLSQLIHFIQLNDKTNYLLIAGFDIMILLLLLYIFIKQLIPALKGKVALELNDEALISYAKNIEIPWKDVKEIEFITGQTSSALHVTFKYETDHGSWVRIPLSVLKGNDEEIYKNVKSYFEKTSSN